jgi:hypothetical protein
MATLEIKKRVANAVWYTNGLIKIENVRFSYPHLDKPFAGKNADGSAAGKPKFGIVGMLPKKTHAEAKQLLVEVMNELLAANKDGKGVAPTVSSDKKFIRNGDDHEQAETYGGHWIVSAREERQPSVRDARANLVTEASAIAKIVYGGAWGHIMIRPWYQDGVTVGKGYGKRVNAGLTGVQHIRDDKPFGEGRVDDTDAWAAEDGKGTGDGMDDDDDI